MDKVSISAVIICLNEQSNIERCLKSLTWVDEVIVYDSGSTDQTLSIAQNLGARVIQGPWLGFGPTKFKATESAKNKWILSVDADEEVPLDLAQEVIQKFSQLNPYRAYKLPRLSFHMGRWIKHGGWYPDAQLRLFNREHYQWDHEPIHEKIEPLGGLVLKTEVLVHPLHHYVFRSVEHQVQTNNRYSTLQAQKMFQAGKRFSTFHFLTKPYVKFIECYIIKLGFLDGWAGYVIARNAAYSVLLKWVKLKEMYAQNK